jgi:hypothetical protein
MEPDMKYFFLLIILVLYISCSESEKIKVVETDQGYLFSENGAHVLFYQKAPKSFDGAYTRNNYVHPLWTLDGDTLTEDYPPDHAHHRGIFWTWHQTWVGDRRLGDAWECRDFIWDVTETDVSDAANGAKTLSATVLWKSPNFVDDKGEMIAAVQENTSITIHPKTKTFRAIDFEIRLIALQDSVKIGGSEDVKGYGGFSPRIKCVDDLTFHSSDGQVQPQNEAVEAGPWMNFLGTFGRDKSGFAILVHPDNPPPINDWILRQKRSMQNPVYPGRDAVAVSKTNPTILKYRVIVHDGNVKIDELYKTYE